MGDRISSLKIIGSQNSDALEDQVYSFFTQESNIVTWPAIVKIKYGEGIAILSGVHFEYSPDDLNPNDKYIREMLPRLKAADTLRIKLARSLLKQLELPLQPQPNPA